MSRRHVDGQDVETAQVFPQEIFDLFIDELKDTPEHLKSSSLVSRSWLPRCQTHLFRHLKVCFVESAGFVPSWSISKICRSGFLLPKQTVSALRVYPLHSFLANPTILHCVRSLSFDLRYCVPHGPSKAALEASLRDLVHHLNFRALESFSLSYPGTVPPMCFERSFLMDLLRKNSMLERLALESMRFDAISMHNLLAYLRIGTPRLRCLSLQGVSLREPIDHLESKFNSTDERSANAPALLAIRELSIGELDSQLTKALLLPVIPHTFDLQAVEFLTIECSSARPSGDDADALPQLLERCSATVTHLTLQDLPESGYGEDSNALVYETIVSSHLRGLIVLKLHAVNFHEGRIYYALRHLSSMQCELEELQIQLTYGPRLVFIPAADTALSEFARIFSRTLRCIRIDVREKIEDFDSTRFMRTSEVVDVEVGVL